MKRGTKPPPKIKKNKKKERRKKGRKERYGCPPTHFPHPFIFLFILVSLFLGMTQFHSAKAQRTILSHISVAQTRKKERKKKRKKEKKCKH